MLYTLAEGIMCTLGKWNIPRPWHCTAEPVLQVKIKFRSKLFKPSLILNFLCLPTLISHNQWINRVGRNLILTCNIYIRDKHTPLIAEATWPAMQMYFTFMVTNFFSIASRTALWRKNTMNLLSIPWDKSSMYFRTGPIYSVQTAGTCK